MSPEREQVRASIIVVVVGFMSLRTIYTERTHVEVCVRAARPDTAKTVPTQERKETPHERAVRLNQRRNDDTAIEAARQRYFVRVSARKLMQEGHGRKRVGT